MPDTTISNLPPGTPASTDVIPFSNGTTTSKVQVQSLPVSYNSLTDKPVITSGVPVGAVFYLATAVVPSGFLKCNGDTVPNGNGTVQGVTANFSALYSALGSVYGALGRLPDLRGEFIRGVDDGRGVDAGRAIGSNQSFAIQNITGSVGPIAEEFGSGGVSSSGALYKVGSSPNSGLTPANVDTSAAGTLGFDASRSVQTASETRPRNVALMPVIKY